MTPWQRLVALSLLLLGGVVIGAAGVFFFHVLANILETAA